jgi:hypothetical protein
MIMVFGEHHKFMLKTLCTEANLSIFRRSGVPAGYALSKLVVYPSVLFLLIKSSPFSIVNGECRQEEDEVSYVLL